MSLRQIKGAIHFEERWEVFREKTGLAATIFGDKGEHLGTITKEGFQTPGYGFMARTVLVTKWELEAILEKVKEMQR